MTSRFFSYVLLCSGLVSLLMAQPMPPDRHDGHRVQSSPFPPRPSVISPFNPGQGGPPIMMDIAELKKLLHEINVNKQSIDKIVVITRTFLTQLDARLIKVQREELNIKEELLKDKPDLSAIKGFIAKKSQIFAEIELSQIKRDVEIKSLLSREEYESLKSAMMKEMKHPRSFNDKMEGNKPVQ
jgi:hypothetical protein